MTEDTEQPLNPAHKPRCTANLEELVEVSGHMVRPGIFKQKANPHNARKATTGQGSGQNPASAAALKAYQVQPGEVRNPHGKPKGTIDLKKAIGRILALEGEVPGMLNPLQPGEKLGKQTALDLMIFTQLRKAINGNTESFRELVNRVDPLPAANTVNINMHAAAIVEDDMLILQHIESPFDNGNVIEGEYSE